MNSAIPEYTFSVVTATQNRAHLLPRVYASLKAQTFGDFEWIIVDDGSTDHTSELARAWMAEGVLAIRYLRETGRGWHVAMNRAVEESRARYINNLDSDDWYAPDALERWNLHWGRIPPGQLAGYFAIVALCASENGEVIGDPFPQDVLDTDHLELRFRYRTRGDKALSCRVEVMREFPYPEDLGRFVTISLTWNRAAQRYRSRCVNEILKYVEYQPDGLTAHTVRIRAHSPVAARTYYKELIHCGRRMTPRDRIRTYANLVRFTLHEGSGVLGSALGAPSLIAWLCGLPPGIALYLRDLWVLRMERSAGPVNPP